MVLAAVDLLLVHEPRCRVAAARTRSGSMQMSISLMLSQSKVSF